MPPLEPIEGSRAAGLPVKEQKVRSMKSFLLRVTIGSVLLVATYGGISPAQAALVTQLDITGGSVDLNFGSLGHVGGTFDRDDLLVMGQYQPLPQVFSPVAVGPWTFSIFTSGLGGDPFPAGHISGANLAVDLRSLFAGVTGPGMHSHALNFGGLATGSFDQGTDRFQLLWSHSFAESGVPFLQSGAFSLHGRAQVEPVPVPGALILFGSGLCGIIGVVVRRVTNVKGPRDRPGSQPEGKGPFGSALILLVSPNAPFAKEIEAQLARSGYHTHVVSSVSDAFPFARQEMPGLTLLDQRLSDWDTLRTDTHFRHVPMMTLVPADTSYSDDDCILDLERGADSVHLCQEGHRLLLAKVGTYLRRAGYVDSKRGLYRVGAVELDSDLHEVKIGAHRVHLSAKPFAILEAFVKAPSKVFSRGDLINLVWGPGFAIGDHTLDVHVHALRQLLQQDPDHLCRLITINGVGFKLKSFSPAVSAPSVPDALPMAVNSLPLLRPGVVHASNTQRSITSSTPGSRRTQLRPVPRQRPDRALRREGSVRHLRNAVSAR